MDSYDDLLYNAPDGGDQRQMSKEQYAAKKKSERDAVFALSDSAAMSAAGGGDSLRQYLDVQSRFDRYSTVNALLIAAQKPDASKLNDFDHWKQQGAYVKPNQKGISILEPHEYLKDDGSPGIGYNVKKVFDISQVDSGKSNNGNNSRADARTDAQPAPPAHDERSLLRALIHKAPMKVTGVDELPDGRTAATDPETGEIFVSRGMGFADTFRSLAYEMCQAEADGPDGAGNPQLAAYCASYMLCAKYGVDASAYQFADKGRAFRGMDAQAVKRELSHIRDAANAVSARMGRQLGAMEKAAKAKNEQAR